LADGWKVDLARAVKTRLLRTDISTLSEAQIATWVDVFKLLT
jgi:hypothetical protein